MNTSAKPSLILPELIGIAGTFASGKDLLARYLTETYGYTHPSTSDKVREIALAQRGSVERDVLYEVANTYRHTHGADVFVKMCLDAARPTVITGLRSLGEAKAIKNAGGVLVFVDAPIKLRYERMQKRDRDSEIHLSLQEFMDREASERHSGDSDADFNLDGIKELADINLDSSPGRDAFITDAEKKLGLSL